MRKKIEIAECAQEQLWDLKMQESLLPKGTILKNVAGVALKTEDVGPALQFLELCRTFSQALHIKDGQPKRILEEITNYKATRSISPLSELAEFQTNLLAKIPTRGRKPREQAGNSWLITIKKLLSNQPFFKDLPPSFFKSGSWYHDLNSTWKLQILNLLCDLALPAKKLNSFLPRESQRKMKIHWEKLPSLQKIMEARNKLKNEVAKSWEPPVDGIVQQFEQQPCELSLLGLKEKLREACCEMLDALKDAKLDQKRDARRPEPLMPDRSGGTYWKIFGYVEGSSILLQDVGNWNPWESNDNADKWFFFSKDEEKIIETHCFSRRVWEEILESALKQDSADERDQGAHDEAMEVSSDEEESDDETTESERDTDYSLNEEAQWEDEAEPEDVMEAALYEEELGNEATESESDTDTTPYEDEEESDGETTEPERDTDYSLNEEALWEDEEEPEDAMEASLYEEESGNEATESESDTDTSPYEDEGESDDETTEPKRDTTNSLNEEAQWEDEAESEDAMEASLYEEETGNEATESESDTDTSPFEEAQLEDEREPGKDAMQASSNEEESDDETTEYESDFDNSLYDEGQSEDEEKSEDETSSYEFESDDEMTDSYSDPDSSL